MIYPHLRIQDSCSCGKASCQCGEQTPEDLIILDDEQEDEDDIDV